MTEHGTVVALAGRRIDALGAEPPRFPLDAVSRVRTALKTVLAEERAVALVASAACGADLVALEVAGELRARTRIVLPFAPEKFRETSVTDRPGDWGLRFDVAVADARARRDLVVLAALSNDADRAYADATLRIIADAQELASEYGAALLAVAVWEGRPRSDTDATYDFLQRAAAAGMRTLSVPTTDS